MLKLVFPLVAALAIPATLTAEQKASPGSQSVAPSGPQVCKHVVSAEPGAKPYQMCMTKAEWAAKKKAESKDPNRTVCKYEQASGTRFKSHKVCMTAAEWDNQRYLERQAIDTLQARSCVRGGGC